MSQLLTEFRFNSGPSHTHLPAEYGFHQARDSMAQGRPPLKANQHLAFPMKDNYTENLAELDGIFISCQPTAAEKVKKSKK